MISERKARNEKRSQVHREGSKKRKIKARISEWEKARFPGYQRKRKAGSQMGDQKRKRKLQCQRG